MNKKTATHNASDVYKAFVQKLLQDNPEYWAIAKRGEPISVWRKGPNKTVVEVISQTRWMLIVNTYFMMARKKVIAGGRFNLGHRLGAIQARTVTRSFHNKQINWQETLKQPIIDDPVTGKKKRAKIIYHMADRYSRIAWEQLKTIANETYYKFKPSKGNSTGKGFAREFSAALKADPLLEFKYKQFNNELPIN